MENAKDNEIDLRLALGVGVLNECVENRDAGANANANADVNSRSRIDTTAGRLSELVWSTQNGLSIKCGDCSKPCNLSDEKFETAENDGEVKCARFIDNKGKEKECISIPVGDVTGTNEENIGDIRESARRGVEETAENDVIVKAEGENSSGESCSSASSKNRKRGFEERLISTSKRLKKQSLDVRKQDSSFMKWISNMVKHDHPADDNDKTLKHAVSRIFGFRSVFQSLYVQRLEETETETKTQRESSKEIILFDTHKSPNDDNLTQNDFPKPPSTLLTTNNSSDCKPAVSAGCKKPAAVASLDALKRTTPMAMRSCFFCGKTGHESRDCLHTNESKKKKNVKVSNLNQIASTPGLLNHDKIPIIPKQLFDTIRRLRLSRTDILKWMNSRSAVANLEGYFIRLRLSKWEEGVGGAGYYVACITDENPSKGCKQPIRVNIGSVQCLVECRYISNCDFLEDELVAWWRTSGRDLMVENLTSKLEEKNKLGLSLPESCF